MENALTVQAEPTALVQGSWQFLPTTVILRTLAQSVCLALLGNSSMEADLIFSAAQGQAEHFSLAKGSKLIRAGSIDALSGVDLTDRKLRIGDAQAVRSWLGQQGGVLSPTGAETLEILERHGKQALMLADQSGDLGVVVCSRPMAD